MAGMRKRLEAWSAAAAMAENGQHDLAREILAGLDPLTSSPTRKFLLVAGGERMSEEAVTYAAGLSARLAADVIIVAPPGRAKGRAARPAEDLRERLAVRLAELKGQARRVAALNWSGMDLPGLVHAVCGAVKGIEFAVIDARIEEAREMRFELPVFHIR